MREKKDGGTFAKYKKIKKRLSQSFGKLSECRVVGWLTPSSPALVSGSSPDCDGRRASPPTKLDKLRCRPLLTTDLDNSRFNGYSAEFLDRPEPNGNIPDRYALGRFPSTSPPPLPPPGWERLHGSDEGCRGGDPSTSSTSAFPKSASSAAPGPCGGKLARQLSVSSDSRWVAGRFGGLWWLWGVEVKMCGGGEDFTTIML